MNNNVCILLNIGGVFQHVFTDQMKELAAKNFTDD